MGDTGMEHIARDGERHAKRTAELRSLGRRHLERATLPKRPKRQAIMNGKGAIKRKRAEITRPDAIDAAQQPIHRADGNETEAVIEEMRRHVGEHDEA